MFAAFWGNSIGGGASGVFIRSHPALTPDKVSAFLGGASAIVKSML
jgi:hypothetical protein